MTRRSPIPPPRRFTRIKGDISELKEYASYYVAAKVDGVKRTVRNIGLYAALGVVGLIAGGAIIATAAGLLIVGLAQGLSRLFGGRSLAGRYRDGNRGAGGHWRRGMVYDEQADGRVAVSNHQEV